jgi:hypothetical protein
LHVQGIYLIFGLVIMHISANALYSFWKKDPLIKAMVTGRKPRGNYEDQQEALIAENVTQRAFICLIASVVIVFGGITLLGGRIL